MRILLLGNTGQLGWELERSLAPVGELTACDYPDIDLADLSSLRQRIRDCRPDVLVNATAYTAVDRAETEPERAHAINALAPGVIAEEVRHLRAAFIHYSTDYVFDGNKGAPYTETDNPNPLNVYGRSKLEGETAISQVSQSYLILRTSWVYSLRRDSFISKVLEWARTQPVLRLVTDQISGPTWARMLAEATSRLVASAGDRPFDWIAQVSGIYHLAGSGYCSRFDWGQQILQLDPHPEDRAVRQVVPAKTTDFPTPAHRPLFSALNCDLFTNTFHFQLPDWKFALKLAMEVE